MYECGKGTGLCFPFKIKKVKDFKKYKEKKSNAFSHLELKVCCGGNWAPR